jgi:hypothetical protein
MSSKPNSPHQPIRASLAAAVNAAIPYRPTTDQEVVDFINHLHAQSTRAHPGAPSDPPLARTTAPHGAPASTAAHHEIQFPRNKPNAQNNTQPAHHGALSEPPLARTAAPHGAPAYTAAHHPTKIAKNEATCHPGPLSPRQLAALRYLVAGYRPTFVAKGLSIDRHTLLRWRRDPLFQAQLQQLHQQLAAKTTAPHPRRP